MDLLVLGAVDFTTNSAVRRTPGARALRIRSYG
jgi:hypothetical protein